MGWLLALVFALSGCEDSEQPSTAPRSSPAPAPTLLDASATVASTFDVAAFCDTVDLELFAGFFGGTPGPIRIVEDACVIDTHSSIGTVTMRHYAGAEALELRVRLEQNSTVQRFTPQGESDTAEPYPTTYVRGQHTVWRIGVDNHNAIVLTAEHCCVEAQRDMLLRIIWQHRM